MIVTKEQYQEKLSQHIEKGFNPQLKVKYPEQGMRTFFRHYMDFIFMYAEKVNMEIETVGTDIFYLVSPSISADSDAGFFEGEDSFQNYQEIKSQTFQP